MLLFTAIARTIFRYASMPATGEMQQSELARGVDMLNTAYHHLDLVPKEARRGRPVYDGQARFRDLYGRIPR